MLRLLPFFALVACRYDFADRQFDARAGSVDAPSCGKAVGSNGVIAGTIGASAGSDDMGSCGGAGTTEDVWTIDIPVDGSQLLAATDGNMGNSIDTVLYIRTSCDPTSEILCDRDSGINAAAAYRLPVNAGHYIVVVDGENGETGAYSGILHALLPQGAPCDGASIRDECAPDFACAGTCVPANCAIQEDLMGATSYARTISTATATNFHAGTCGEGNDGGARAPEVIDRLVLATAASNVHISTDNPNTNYDTLIYLRDGCAGAEIACNDDDSSSTANNSIIDTGPLAAGTYYLFIDGFSVRSGTADLTVTITP